MCRPSESNSCKISQNTSIMTRDAQAGRFSDFHKLGSERTLARVVARARAFRMAALGLLFMA